MDDATRPRGADEGELEAARSAVSELVGELTHSVLGLFRVRGMPLAERFTLAGGDPFEVMDVFVVTLRVLADGLETPNIDWLNG
jgi:hypothetical protein